MVLSDSLLLLFFFVSDVVMLSGLERGDEGGEGPPGAVSIWSWSSLFFGRPLNLVLYIPFRIFVYSSNIFKSNFDLMDSTGFDACFRDLEVS
jgi:hypothetical protein